MCITHVIHVIQCVNDSLSCTIWSVLCGSRQTRWEKTKRLWHVCSICGGVIRRSSYSISGLSHWKWQLIKEGTWWIWVCFCGYRWQKMKYNLEYPLIEELFIKLLDRSSFQQFTAWDASFHIHIDTRKCIFKVDWSSGNWSVSEAAVSQEVERVVHQWEDGRLDSRLLQFTC